MGHGPVRTLSTTIHDHLDANTVLVMADLFVVTSAMLGVARFTSWGSNVVFGGNTYVSGGVIPELGDAQQRLGLDVDQFDVRIGHGGTALYGSTAVTWKRAVDAGAIDGASVKVFKAFFDFAGALVDAVLLFGGAVGPIQPGSTEVVLTVESPAAKLKQNWPRALIQPSCRHKLYDAGCGLSRVTAWDALTTIADSTAALMLISGHSGEAAGFTGGTVEVVAPSTSPLYGMMRAIAGGSAYEGGANLALLVAPAWPSAPAAGLTVKLTRGCDKRVATCRETFGNIAHFSGAPMVPPDSTRT